MSEQTPNPNETPPKQTATDVFLEEVTRPSAPKGASRGRRLGQTLLIPALAIFTGLVMGAIFIVLTSPAFYAALQVSIIAGLKEVVLNDQLTRKKFCDLGVTE